MLRRVIPMLITIILLPAYVLAGSIDFQQDTPAQKILAQYIDTVNNNLFALGEQPINSIFASYPSFADFGITDSPESEIPEGVEIHVSLYQETMNILTLRVSDLSRFSFIAAAFLQAASPESITLEEAKNRPESKVRKALSSPLTAFHEEITELNGTMVYAYYAYYPNQYHDQVNWMEMTMVFPLSGYEANTIGEAIPSGADTIFHEEDADASYEGYNPEDDFSHLDIAPQATPEPDSAAAEEMENWK